MFKQLRYEFRVRRSLRLYALAALVVFDLLLYVLFARGSLLGGAGDVLAIVFSSIALAALLSIGLYCDIDALQRLFSPPAAYHVHLAPVSVYSLLGSRIVINVLQDAIFAIVGTFFLLLQLTAMIGDFTFGVVMNMLSTPDTLSTIVSVCVGYLLLTIVIYFGATLSSSVFGSLRLRKPLSILVATAALYIVSQLAAPLIPLHNGVIYQTGLFVAFEIMPLPSLPAFALLALELLACAGLFIVTGKLMERKLNLL